MASEVDIANRALSMLGDQRIISLTDNNKPARAMKARYALLRDAELAAYPWRFAVKRAQLPASTDVPAWGYSTIYDRPVDDLRAIAVGGIAINDATIGITRSASGYRSEESQYEIIEGRIHTDLSAPLDYEYIAQITDAGQFDQLFVEALAARMAADAAEELTQSKAKKEHAAFVYREALMTARRNNAIMRPPRRRSSGRWMNSRII